MLEEQAVLGLLRQEYWRSFETASTKEELHDYCTAWLKLAIAANLNHAWLLLRPCVFSEKSILGQALRRIEREISEL